jgi:hypothetical protein
MTDDHFSCTVEISSDEIDAGADITLKVRVEFPRKGKLNAPRVLIRNHGDAELTSAELTKSDDGAYESDDIVVKAPGTVGEHVYRAVVVVADKNGKPQEQAAADIRFTVQAHAAHVNVWDVPSTVVVGERFKVTVGVKCSAGCDLHGYALRIVGEGGAEAGAATLGNDIWPGTDALYFTEVEADAPAATGLHSFDIRTAGWVSELPHAAGSATLSLRIVNRPECEVTVEVVDRDKQTPIEGAVVVLHPYRATTGANGIATLKVTKGPYDIMVSGPGYISASMATEVTADMATRAELDEEPPPELEFGY